MAALENDQLVVRLVYTGPPMAGKTQSVRALMPLLKGKGADGAVMSPGEWRGRTAFFDFADYVGGAYEGKPIRCQILSTPGQVALSDRRELLLRAADAVIMVVASQPEALERAMQCYEEMDPWLTDAGRDVPIRLILQCNKQDLPDAIPSDEIGRILGLPCGKDVYATSARTGKGLRAAFVAGVRNAVERARALVAKGVPLDTLEIESGQELFERMRREVAPLGSIQPRAPSANAAGQRVASPAARVPNAGRVEGKPSPVASSASSANPTARPARSPTKPSQSGLFPSTSLKTTAAPGARASTTTAAPGKAAGSTPASTRTTVPGQKAPFRMPAARQKAPSTPAASGVGAARSGSASSGSASTRPVRSSPEATPSAHGAEPLRPTSVPPASPSDEGASRAGAVPRPKPSESAPAGGAHPPTGELGNPKVSSAPPSGTDRPALRGSRAPAAASKRAPAAGWQPLGERGPAAHGAGRQERARAARPTSASSASASTGAAAAAHGAGSAALGGRADGVTVRAPAPREAAPASSARRTIALPPVEARGVDDAESVTDATGQPARGSLDPAGDAARAWRPGSGPRPFVLPASVYHSWVPSSSDPISGVALHPVGKEPGEGPALRPTQAWFKPRRRRDVAAPQVATPELRPRAPLLMPAAQPFRHLAGAARPAVMPAAAYFAAREAAGLSEPQRAGPTDALDGPLDAGVTSPAGVSGAALALAADSEVPRASRARAASTASRSSDSSVPPTHASRQAALEAAAAPRSAARPAVMPASAYLASIGSVREDTPTRSTIAPSQASETLAVTAVPNARGGQDDSAAPGSVSTDSSSGPARGSEADRSESPVQRARPGQRSSRPAVMPARAWRSALLIQPESSSPEWAAPRLADNGSDGLRESSASANGGAPEAPASRKKNAAMPALRLVKGGTLQRRPDEPKSPGARPALTLLSRPAVMPASAWRATPPMAPDPTTAPDEGTNPGSRPAVIPASAWKLALAAAEAKAWRGTPDQPAFAPTPFSSAPPSWEVAPPDEASWDVEPSGPASSEAASIHPASANASNAAGGGDPSPEAERSRSPSLEARPSEPADAAQPSEGPPSPGRLPPGVQAAPGHDVPVATPDRYRLTRASTHGLEFSSLMPVDEPSESFRIPETPPGLQAFVAASRRALFPYPATEHGGDERNERDPGTALSVNAASESPPRTATLSEGTAGAPPSEPTAAPHIHPCAEPVGPLSDPLDTGTDSDSEDNRMDSVHAMSLAPTPGEDETPPFSFPGPHLPGQARIPRAVWPRACWRTLETQLTAYASAISDARGRWIGELAPGWFARTLRKAPDERVARRAFAEQVLRERKLGRYLSRPRCVVLTEETDGFWIWQVACRVPTLATILRPRLGAGESPSDMAGALLDAALGYLDARQRFVEARVPLPLSPHALSFQDGKIVYSGLMPDPGAVFVEPAGNGYAALQDALRKMWPDAPVDAQTVLAELHGKAAGRLPEPLLEIIRSVLGQR